MKHATTTPAALLPALMVLLAAALAAPAPSAAQEAQEGGALTLEMAQEAMDAAEEEARRNGWDVTIVVTDGEGVPVYLRRLDGASARSYEIAMAKAATVAASGLPTAVYGERLEAGQVDEVPDGITFPGGVPVLRGGQLIGAIGTSGVRGVQDEQVSRAGAEAIGD